MPNCPKCKRNIDQLGHSQSGCMIFKCKLDNHISNTTNNIPNIDYDQEEFVEDGNINEWFCRECNETLFFNEEKATEFLNGGETK